MGPGARQFDLHASPRKLTGRLLQRLIAQMLVFLGLCAPASATGEIPEQEISVPGLEATIRYSGSSHPFSAGTSAFAEITLNRISAGKPVSATLTLESMTARIQHVSGKKIALGEQHGSSRRVTVSGLRKGKPRRISVEVLLKPGSGETQTPSEETDNRLKVTLHPLTGQEGVQDSVEIAWRVTDCTAAFHSRLKSIDEKNSSRMGEALKASWARDRRRAGGWLFRAPSLGRAKRKCTRWVKRWDARYGRYRARCIRSRVIARPRTGVRFTKEERAVVQFASRLVRDRARDRRLGREQPLGWASQKVASDVRRYLKQEKHPALCTGAPGFVTYYSDRMKDVDARANLFQKQKARAIAAVRTRVRHAHEVMHSSAEGHPAWGAAPLTLTVSGDDASLAVLIADLAALSGDQELAAELRKEDDSFTALKRMKTHVKKGGLKSLPSALRTAILQALTLIEAADYINAVETHYAALTGSITGSLKAVAQAHENLCHCGR